MAADYLPLLTVGVKLLVLAVEAAPGIARIIQRGIAASSDTDDASLAAFVDEQLAGLGHSAAAAERIRARRDGA